MAVDTWAPHELAFVLDLSFTKGDLHRGREVGHFHDGCTVETVLNQLPSVPDSSQMIVV